MPKSHRFINRALVQRGAREQRHERMAQLAQSAWGQAWLARLRQSDPTNRLSRGMELARQGAVTGLQVREGLVQAQVQQQAAPALSVQLTLKPFTPTQTNSLLQAIARQPAWLDQLLNNRLPSGIDQVLRQAEVQLFPLSWQDLNLRCSCADTNVPCLHQAALLHQLAADIDDQPMLLFHLRGVNLEQQLRSLSEVDGLAPTALHDLRVQCADPAAVSGSKQRPGASMESLQRQLVSPEAKPNVKVAHTALTTSFFDYWSLLLPSRPPFFPQGHLAQLYVSYLRKAAEFWRSSHIEDVESDAIQDADAKLRNAVPAYGLPDVPAWQAHHLRLELDAAGSFLRASLLDAQLLTLHVFNKEFALLSYLERLAQDRRALSPVTQSVLVEAFLLARQLVAQGAVVPRLLSLGGDDYRVRWEAATQDDQVAAAVRELAQHPGLSSTVTYVERAYADDSEEAMLLRLREEVAAIIDDPEAQILTPLASQEELRHYHPVAADAVHALLGALLRPMLMAGVEEVLAKAEHAAVQLLFLGRPVNLSNAGDSQLSIALPLWLRRLRLHHTQHRLILQIEEVDAAPGQYTLRPLLLLEGADAPETLTLHEATQGQLGNLSQLDQLIRLQVQRDLALLAEAYAPLAAFVPAAGNPPEQVELYGADFANFLFEVAPALRLTGAQVLMPHGLDRAARPRLSAVVQGGDGLGAAATAGGEAVGSKRARGLLGLESLVTFDWQVAVGEQLITAAEFADLTDRYEGIVRLRDGFVWLEPLQTARLLQRLAAPPQPSAAVQLQSVLLGRFQGGPLQLSQEVIGFRQNLLDAAATANLPLHLEGLNATLRPYQRCGRGLVATQCRGWTRQSLSRRYGPRQNPPNHRAAGALSGAGAVATVAGADRAAHQPHHQLDQRARAFCPRVARGHLPRAGPQTTGFGESRCRVDELRGRAIRRRQARHTQLGRARDRRGPTDQESCCRADPGREVAGRPNSSRPLRHPRRESAVGVLERARFCESRVSRTRSTIRGRLCRTDRARPRRDGADGFSADHGALHSTSSQN